MYNYSKNTTPNKRNEESNYGNQFIFVATTEDIVYETNKAVAAIIGYTNYGNYNIIGYFPKSCCKLIEDKLYVAQWLLNNRDNFKALTSSEIEMRYGNKPNYKRFINDGYYEYSQQGDNTIKDFNSLRDWIIANQDY